MFLKVLCLCLSFIVFVGCGEKEKQSAHQKPIVVVTSPDNPPFEFKDTAKGGDKVIGFDMDVIQKIGEHLGRPIQIVEAEFAGIIPALQAGRADMAIAGLSPTEERKKSVDFSMPYHIDKKALLVLKNSPISSEKDLSNQKLGVQLGSAHETFARKWAQHMPGLTLVSLGKIGEMVQELKNGRIQAILFEDTAGRAIAESTPGLKVIVLSEGGGPSAIAFPKNSPLVAPTNKALQEMKGEIQELESKWFSS